MTVQKLDFPYSLKTLFHHKKMKTNKSSGRLFIASLIFALLYNFGCTSYRIISSYDLPDPGKYHYTIYGNKTVFPLENTLISHDSIRGKVNMSRKYLTNSVHIYLVSDYVIKVDPTNRLSIPQNSIARVEKSGNSNAKSRPEQKTSKSKVPAGVVILGILTTAAALIVRSAWPGLNR